MKIGEAVESGFVLADEVKESPDGSIQAGPHYAMQSSQIEKPACKRIKYLETWFDIELGYRNATNGATIWCVHTNFNCSPLLLR